MGQDRFESWRRSAEGILHSTHNTGIERLLAERLVTVCQEHEGLSNLNATQAETIRKLSSGPAEPQVPGLRNTVELLERRLRQREERIERMRAKEERNRETFMRLRADFYALRDRVRPLAAGPDVRTVLDMDHVVDFGSKHRGKTMAHVAAGDPSWVVWLENEHSSMRPAVGVLEVARDVISGMRRRAGRPFTNSAGEPVSAWGRLADRKGWNETRTEVSIHAPDAASFRKDSLVMSLMETAPGSERLAAAVHRSKYGRTYPLDDDCYFPAAEWWQTK